MQAYFFKSKYHCVQWAYFQICAGLVPLRMLITINIGTQILNNSSIGLLPLFFQLTSSMLYYKLFFRLCLTKVLCNVVNVEENKGL